MNRKTFIYLFVIISGILLLHFIKKILENYLMN